MLENKFTFLKESVPSLLSNLKADCQPLWGKMSAQQMVEHLSLQLTFSIEKIKAKPLMPEERMAFYKAKFFRKDKPYPRYFTAKGYLPPRPLPPLKYDDLDTAKAIFNVRLEEFFEYFEGDPLKLTFQPFFGYLGFEEWIFFNAKHFHYHFMQFGLTNEEGENIKERCGS